MRYEYKKPHRRFFGPVHWGHCLFFYCKPNRFPELSESMAEVVGPNEWRFKLTGHISRHGAIKQLIDNPFACVLRFQSKQNAMRAKLIWHPCEPPAFAPVRLSIIRQTMPSIIASQIVAVQPMTAQLSDIHTLRLKHEV